MGLFDYFFKKREEQKREKQCAEEANHRKLYEEHIANEKRLEENRRKEAECQARLKLEREQVSLIEPFTFKSNCHQRYENGQPKMGLQECFRTVYVEKNIDGCNGYRLEPGVGYIVKVFNDDLGKPNMSDKPMKVVRKTENFVELRGFPIEAMSPFGWQEVDYSVYGLTVHYEHGKINKCVLHMYDRDIRIEYLAKPIKYTSHASTSINNSISVKVVANGNPFNIKFNSIHIVKQFYDGQSQNITIDSSVITTISRKTINGLVNFDIENITELRNNGILQSNPSFNPSFYYNADAEGNEFASAEVGNTIATATSRKEYVSLFQVTRQNGNLIAFIINNLPNEDDFYYLIIFKE